MAENVMDWLDDYSDKNIGSASQAIWQLVNGKEYPLILMDVHVAPGMGCDDPVIKGLVRSRDFDGFDVGIRLIELLRREGSVNRETPIVVYSTYDPVDHPDFLDARDRCRAVGANEYFSRVSIKRDIVPCLRRLLSPKSR